MTGRAGLLLLALYSAGALPAPFLVSDSDPTGGADRCVYQEGTAAAVESPLAAIPPSTLIGSCKIDLAGFSAGSHSLQVWFRSSLWSVESAKVPFVFARPAAGFAGPTGLRLQP